MFTLTNPPLAFEAEAYINWLTDITNGTPTLVGSKIAWELPEFDIPIGVGGILGIGDIDILADAKVLKAFLPRLYVAWKENKWVAN